MLKILMNNKVHENNDHYELLPYSERIYKEILFGRKLFKIKVQQNYFPLKFSCKCI